MMILDKKNIIKVPANSIPTSEVWSVKFEMIMKFFFNTENSPTKTSIMQEIRYFIPNHRSLPRIDQSVCYRKHQIRWLKNSVMLQLLGKHY